MMVGGLRPEQRPDHWRLQQSVLEQSRKRMAIVEGVWVIYLTVPFCQLVFSPKMLVACIRSSARRSGRCAC